MRDASLDLLVDLARPTSHDAVLDYATGAGMAGFARGSRRRDRRGGRRAARTCSRRASASRPSSASSTSPSPSSTSTHCRTRTGRSTSSSAATPSTCCPSPATALAELQRVLSPGGRIVVLDAVVDETIDKAFNEIARLREPAHRRHYRATSSTSIVARAGLAVRSARRAAAHHRPGLLAAGGRGAAAEGEPHPRPLQGAAGRGPGGPGRRLLRQARQLQQRRRGTAARTGVNQPPPTCPPGLALEGRRRSMTPVLDFTSRSSTPVRPRLRAPRQLLSNGHAGVDGFEPLVSKHARHVVLLTGQKDHGHVATLGDEHRQMRSLDPS